MARPLFSFILIAVLALATGCGAGEQVRAAKNALAASQAAYESCLKQHPADPSRCEALKRAYENDCLVYEEASKGGGGPTTTMFIEVGPGR